MFILYSILSIIYNRVIIIFLFYFSFRLEWKDLSGISIDTNLLRLRQVAVEGDLKISKFRSICWALLLGIFKNQSFHWVNQRRYDREQ